MARKLKTYLTSIGFYDLAIAAPSMKAALEAWGAESNLFHQGAASETTDAKIVAAAMASPGAVVKRPVGSNKAFAQEAELPERLTEKRSSKRAPAKKARRGRVSSKDSGSKKDIDNTAAVAFERERKRRERDQVRAHAVSLRSEQRRKRAVDTAEGKINTARAKHEAKAAEIRSQIDKLEQNLLTEDARWERESERLEALVRRAERK